MPQNELRQTPLAKREGSVSRPNALSSIYI